MKRDSRNVRSDNPTESEGVTRLQGTGTDGIKGISEDSSVQSDGVAEKGTAGGGPAGSERFPIVGIGASAGGLRAFEQFFDRLPVNTGMAFVLVQHLDPERQSELAGLLQRYTRMEVRQVEHATQVEPDHVYVIPPGKELSIKDGILFLSEPQRKRGFRTPIDLFFRSLADDQKEHAVCIILSGAGSDGALGLRTIKEHAGLTLAQDPEEAAYDGMPKSAVATGQVDIVAPVTELADKLVSYVEHSMALPRRKQIADGGVEEITDRLLRIVRSKAGIDFSGYKRATILRRFTRRLQILGFHTPDAYLDYLESHPRETRILVKDFLISVTCFFRDSDSFELLEKQVIPDLFKKKGSGESIRVWVTGCATGEEAYSIAMLLCEHAAGLDNAPAVQVFATELDSDALAVAREGRYPDAISTDVSAERLQRFFDREEGGYRVKDSLKEVILFAPHNLLEDPPFSRLDLITCRNLLIYLSRPTQEQVLTLFHYALLPDGFLFLGSSESTDVAQGLFRPASRKHRIYRPRSASKQRLPGSYLQHPLQDFEGRKDGEKKKNDTTTLEGIHLSRITRQYTPPSVIVDENGDIQHLFGGVEQYLHLRAGEPSLNLLHVAPPSIRLELRTAMFAASQRGEKTVARHLTIGDDQQRRRINLMVEPVDLPEIQERYIQVVLEDREPIGTPEKHDGVPTEDKSAAMLKRLEEELERTKERLHTTTEEFETSTEELRVSNEELQSMNEELRSTTEELETSREELQSTNEELVTVNHELQAKIEQLSQANADLENLIASTEIGTIFVDDEGRIMKFTPRAVDLFHLIQADLGRPFAHVTHELKYESLLTDTARVFREGKVIEKEVESQSGKWHIARILPYRKGDKIKGIVLAFIDITQRREAETALRQRESELMALNATLELRVNERTSELTLANRTLERRNQELQDFAYVASHDLQEPLRKILIFSDLLANDYGDRLDENGNSYLSRMQNAAERMTTLITDLLTLSRVATRGKPFEEVDLNEIVGSVVADLEIRINETNGVIQIDQLPVIEADPVQMRQLVTNLVNNALKFHRDGVPPHVQISAEVVSVQDIKGKEHKEVCQLTVADNGIGIDQKYHEKIFTPFQRLHGNGEFDGTGMGLAICQRIVDRHGGTIKLESTLGDGSRFIVSLPISRKKSQKK